MNGAWFSRFSRNLSAASGRATTFIAALVMILVWLVSGPIFDFSDTWQLIINTTTTIITFLMVFLIQNTQNRDTTAIQLKLDELVRATATAHNTFLDLECLDDETLEKLQQRYEKLAEKARQRGELETAVELQDAAEEIGEEAEGACDAAPAPEKKNGEAEPPR